MLLQKASTLRQVTGRRAQGESGARRVALGSSRFRVYAADIVVVRFDTPAMQISEIGAPRGDSESTIRIGKLLVHLDSRTVKVDGQPLRLTKKEYNILELLSLRKATALTIETFLHHLYGGRDEPELKIFDVFVCKLRKKLNKATAGANYIETVWGRGYVLRDPACSGVTPEHTHTMA